MATRRRCTAAPPLAHRLLPTALPCPVCAGKSRGFAFVAYEDQRSTVLVVDNLSGGKVAGRTVRVEHVDNYRRKRAEVRVRVCVCLAS